MKKLLKTIPYIIISILIGITVAYAGTLTPPGPPAKSMKSLADLYELLNTGANTPSIDFATSETVSSTMHSLEDTYDLLKTKIENIDTTKILTGTTIFGKQGVAVVGIDTSDSNATALDIISPKTAYVNGVKIIGQASAGTPALIFASSDATTYQCEWLTTDSTQPAVTLETICGHHTGCTWADGACVGEIQTPFDGYFTWYSAKAICENSTEGGINTWRLPTNIELLTHYMDNNNSGNRSTNLDDDYYWSDSTYQYLSDNSLAYFISMFDGSMDYGSKTSLGFGTAHCVH